MSVVVWIGLYIGIYVIAVQVYVLAPDDIRQQSKAVKGVSSFVERFRPRVVLYI